MAETIRLPEGAPVIFKGSGVILVDSSGKSKDREWLETRVTQCLWGSGGGKISGLH
jgi:hypothetical protein